MGAGFAENPLVALKCVAELDVLRDDYKAKRADAANTQKGVDEYCKWDDAQRP